VRIAQRISPASVILGFHTSALDCQSIVGLDAGLPEGNGALQAQQAAGAHIPGHLRVVGELENQTSISGLNLPI